MRDPIGLGSTRQPAGLRASGLARRTGTNGPADFCAQVRPRLASAAGARLDAAACPGCHYRDTRAGRLLRPSTTTVGLRRPRPAGCRCLLPAAACRCPPWLPLPGPPGRPTFAPKYNHGWPPPPAPGWMPLPAACCRLPLPALAATTGATGPADFCAQVQPRLASAARARLDAAACCRLPLPALAATTGATGPADFCAQVRPRLASAAGARLDAAACCRLPLPALRAGCLPGPPERSGARLA